MTPLGEAQPHQQQTLFTCGATCLLAIAEDYGVTGLDEAAVARLIGVTQDGAYPVQLVRAARQLGFPAEERRFRSLAEAKAVTDQGLPIIANILSFTQPGGGHFVVITKIDDAGVHLMDPNVPGNRRLLTHDEMMARWRTRRGSGVVVARRSAALGASEVPERRWPLVASLLLLASAGGLAVGLSARRGRRRTASRAPPHW